MRSRLLWVVAVLCGCTGQVGSQDGGSGGGTALGGGGGSASGGGAPCDPAAIQATLFVPTCATAGCHSAQAAAGALDLESAGVEARVVNVAASCTGKVLVRPGNASASWLYEKVSNPSPACGTRMPLSGALSSADQACVATWISSLSGVDAGCATDRRDCAGVCVDAMTDNSNCGSCGVACTGGQSCSAGKCVCGAGQQLCGSACVDLSTNDQHCGQCGNACTGGASCSNGACGCASGQYCGGACVDVLSNDSHCGSCASACDGGMSCSMGQCACAAQEQLCAGQCTATLTDHSNCGQCGHACGANEVCNAGVCTTSCAGPLQACGGACVNEQTDPQHCGSCTAVCATGGGCDAGACGCPAGESVCGGACLDLRTDFNNCGQCGHACSAGQVCVNGTCGGCAPGKQLCNGVCVPLNDVANCGACGVTCGAGGTCAQQWGPVQVGGLYTGEGGFLGSYACTSGACTSGKVWATAKDCNPSTSSKQFATDMMHPGANCRACHSSTASNANVTPGGCTASRAPPTAQIIFGTVYPAGATHDVNDCFGVGNVADAGAPWGGSNIGPLTLRLTDDHGNQASNSVEASGNLELVWVVAAHSAPDAGSLCQFGTIGTGGHVTCPTGWTCPCPAANSITRVELFDGVKTVTAHTTQKPDAGQDGWLPVNPQGISDCNTCHSSAGASGAQGRLTF